MESRSICILAGLLVATIALADGAYKWTDEEGVVHYSDVPRAGAEVVDLEEPELKSSLLSLQDKLESQPLGEERIALTTF